MLHFGVRVERRVAQVDLAAPALEQVMVVRHALALGPLPFRRLLLFFEPRDRASPDYRVLVFLAVVSLL